MTRQELNAKLRRQLDAQRGEHGRRVEAISFSLLAGQVYPARPPIVRAPKAVT